MQSTTETRSSQLGRFEAILHHLCNWKAIALLFAVIVAVDTIRAQDSRSWAMLLVAAGMGALALVQWEIMRRQGVVIRALEQLLGPDLDGTAHPEMEGTFRHLRAWFEDVRRC